METVQGKELEKILKDEGVIDEDCSKLKFERNKSSDISNSNAGNVCFL